MHKTKGIVNPYGIRRSQTHKNFSFFIAYLLESGIEPETRKEKLPILLLE
jgi:hypothetical protein